MTVTYTSEIASARHLGLLRLLKKWRGSIYRLLILEFPIFVIIHYTISILYTFVLNKDQRVTFRNISRYCESHISQIPLAFILGFFNSLIMSRWWQQVLTIPWPDGVALYTTQYLRGSCERCRLMRRTIVRYVCLSYLITMASISVVVKKRFPKFKNMTDAGFMTKDEQTIIENIKTPHNKYFVPLAWAANIVQRARVEEIIKEDYGVKSLLDEIKNFRFSLGRMFLFDWIPVPLVYTQVVTIAVYAYFIPTLIGRQLILYETNEESSPCTKLVLNPFPVLTFLEFFFHMGWLKVAECFLYPFGEDDDDIDLNTFVDRNLQASYLIVDDMHTECPELVKDRYWDEVEFDLPYNKESLDFRRPSYLGAALDKGDKERKFSIFGWSHLLPKDATHNNNNFNNNNNNNNNNKNNNNDTINTNNNNDDTNHNKNNNNNININNKNKNKKSFDNSSFVGDTILEEKDEDAEARIEIKITKPVDSPYE